MCPCRDGRMAPVVAFWPRRVIWMTKPDGHARRSLAVCRLDVRLRDFLQKLDDPGVKMVGHDEFTIRNLLVDERREIDEAVESDDQNTPLVFSGDGAEVDLTVVIESKVHRTGGVFLDVDEIVFGDFGEGADKNSLSVGRNLNRPRL